MNFPLQDDEVEQYEILTAGLFDLLDDLDVPLTADDLPLSRSGSASRDAGHTSTPQDDPLNAIVRWCQVRGESEGQLSGKRVGLKDSFAVAGIPMTAGSNFFEFTPSVDSIVARRILDAGGEIVAVTNMDSLAFSGGGETSDYRDGIIRNPHDHNHTAGGSSGGSAAALYYDNIDVTMGTDQGGSIRLPASWCGVIGLKPTHGLVPYAGILGIDKTFDHAGPMGRSVADVAALLQAVAGSEEDEPGKSERRVVDYGAAVAGAKDELSTTTIALLSEGFQEPVDEGVRRAVLEVVDRMRGLGAQITEVSVPEHLLAGGTAFISFIEGMWDNLSSAGNGFQHAGLYDPEMAEAMLTSWNERAAALPPTVKITAMLGRHLREKYHGLYYSRAQNRRRALRAAYDRAFGAADFLVMPTAPTPAHRAEPDLAMAERVLRGWAPLANTSPFNMTGHPAISIPAGSCDGLPIGVQLVARHDSDAALLELARVYEASHGWFTGSR
jgi:amidase